METVEHISKSEKKEKLINYYKNKGLLIVGLNDSQGVNTTSLFFKGGLLDYLKEFLTSKELKPVIIDAFSLTMNKTEHIDYYLKNNISIEEIKLSQFYSIISALEKILMDIGLDIKLNGISNIYRSKTSSKNAESIKISTSLQKVEEPVLIYSSGINNLMLEVGSNPFEIKRAYKERNKKPSYYYALEKASNPTTIKRVVDSIEENFNTILGINSHTDIYTLGGYIPKSLQREEMELFRDLIIAYNEELLNLCKQYGIAFVDTETIGKKYNTSNNNFHISSLGHVALANCLLDNMYNNKIETRKPVSRKIISPIKITNKAADGVLEDLLIDYEKSCLKAEELSGCEKERQMEIAMEHKREIEIFQKVLTKVKNK